MGKDTHSYRLLVWPARTGPVVSEQGLRNTRWMTFVPAFSTEDGERCVQTLNYHADRPPGWSSDDPGLPALTGRVLLPVLRTLVTISWDIWYTSCTCGFTNSSSPKSVCSWCIQRPDHLNFVWGISSHLIRPIAVIQEAPASGFLLPWSRLHSGSSDHLLFFIFLLWTWTHFSK